jgi:hypothetical protein
MIVQHVDIHVATDNYQWVLHVDVHAVMVTCRTEPQSHVGPSRE